MGTLPFFNCIGTVMKKGSVPIFSGLAEVFASVGGLGRAPIASGTVGSAAGLVAAWLLPVHLMTQLVVIGVLSALAVWASGTVAASHRDEDPSLVVIDEFVGMLVACVLLPRTPLWFAAAFLLFRFFDIGKWFPMKQLERLPGGWGIVADDLAAGVLARLVLTLWV